MSTPFFTKIETEKIRQDLSRKIEAIRDNQITGVKVFETFAGLPATGAAETSYKVVNDNDSSKNGYYHWNGTIYIKDVDFILQEVLTSNVSEAVSGKAVYEHINISLSNFFERGTSFVDETTDSGTFKNEASTFSGWGCGIGNVVGFNTVAFKIRGFNPSELPTVVTVRIKEVNSGGAVLAEKTVNFSEVDENDLLTVVFDTTVASAGYLWFEYSTDGRVGWHGKTNIGNATQNETQTYLTSKNPAASPTTPVSSGALNVNFIKFYTVATEYVLTQAGRDSLIESLGVNNSLLDLFKNVTTYDSLTSEVTPTFITGNARNNPFSGWGATFNKVNKSFNALKVEKLRRGSALEAEKWAFIKFFVKNDKSDENPLAVSDFLSIDPEATTVNEILAPLKDPITGEFKTLDDSSFSGAEYFIGYLYYNIDKAVAYGGETLGSQSNYSGNSYYNTNQNDTTWSTYTGNPTVPFEHILLVNPKNDYSLKELDSVNNRLTALESTQGEIPRIILPNYFDAVVGKPQQLFFRGMIEAINPFDYNIKVTGGVNGKQYPRYYEFTPTSAGTFSLVVSIYTKDNILVNTASCDVIANIQATSSPASLKRVLCVGDSLTAGGVWVGELQRLLTQSSGNPQGLGLNNIEFIGTAGSGVNKYEGYGGKTWGWFISKTTNPDVDFTVASHNKDNSDLVSIWRDSNNNDWTLESVGNSTTLIFSRYNHTSNAPASGVLTHVSGANNTSDINYTAVENNSGTVVNKFWNNSSNELDFQNYITENNFGGIDYVCVLLTWNGMSGDRATADAHSGLINDAKVFIDKMHAQYPNAKIKIMGIQLPSIDGGLAQNYGDADSSYGNYFALARTVFGLNLAYKELAEDANYSSFVEFVNVSAQFDSLYNMPKGQRAVNLRNSTDTEQAGTNGVHPANEGYLQIADAIFRNMNKEF